MERVNYFIESAYTFEPSFPVPNTVIQTQMEYEQVYWEKI